MKPPSPIRCYHRWFVKLEKNGFLAEDLSDAQIDQNQFFCNSAHRSPSLPWVLEACQRNRKRLKADYQ